MDIYCHDRFYDNMVCDLCNRNTYYNNSKCYCITCKRVFFVRFKKADNRSRVVMKNNCKIQHFKNKLNELISYNLPSIIFDDFKDYISKNNISNHDIDICVVENYLKTISSSVPDSMMKYHLLNLMINGRPKPTMLEVNAVVNIFQIFVAFIQDIEPNFTMKYDFYITKIFNFLKIPYAYNKKEFKDNTKKNKDNCYWTKFIQYGLAKYKDNNVLHIPEDDQDF